MARISTYALITSARDEEQFIELTLKSLVAQTVLPIKWLIVSDGSTDGTDEIVKKYVADHPWIELLRMPERRERHFGGKAHAVNAAYARIRHLQFDAIGNLDGDVSFDEAYFAYLLGRLDRDPTLGIVGTPFREDVSQAYDYRFASDENVPGPCQLFRRECFEKINGYAPMKHGGVDHVALISARMNGWKTKVFPDRVFVHHRQMGTAQHGALAASFHSGIKDYRLGGHPLWEVFRVAYQVTKRPILLGAVVLATGYLWALVQRMKRQVPSELIAFHRREQMRRLRRLFTNFPQGRVTEAGRSHATIMPGGNLGLSGSSMTDMCASTTDRESKDCSDALLSRATLELPYVLITPARNEAQFIEMTIECVVSQTVRPLRWVIVSDGSTDGTDEIVKKHTADHPWIELMRMPERHERHFGGKAHAVNAAYASVQDLPFQVICSLDGDISIDKGYFAFLLSRLVGDPALGVVGTPFAEHGSGKSYDYRLMSKDHVSGACQMFRRQCFEDINGYFPVEGGGVDHIALISARMRGWKTRCFTEAVCFHHRKIGTAQHGVLRARFKSGVKDYALGGHPIWECFRVIYQMTQKPVIVGGVLLGAGYVWVLVRRARRPVSHELVAFHRRDQMRRLKSFLSRKGIVAGERLQRPT